MALLFQVQTLSDVAQNTKRIMIAGMPNSQILDVEKLVFIPKPYDNIIEGRVPVKKGALPKAEAAFVEKLEKEFSRILPENALLKDMKLVDTFNLLGGGGKQIVFHVQMG